MVTIYRKGEGLLIGTGQEVLRHHLELRGVGVIDVMTLFGIRGIRIQKRLEIEVRLEEKKDISLFDRTGLDQQSIAYLGVKMPLVRLPIFPGKNITVIAEAIALNATLKLYGYDTAKEFNKRLIELMKRKSVQNRFLSEFLE